MNNRDGDVLALHAQAGAMGNQTMLCIGPTKLRVVLSECTTTEDDRSTSCTTSYNLSGHMSPTKKELGTFYVGLYFAVIQHRIRVLLLLPFYIKAMNLQNKTAVVTGGCGGLGAAISHAFLEAGANVVAIDINRDLISTFTTQAEKAYSGKVLVQDCDITNETALQALFEAAADKFGQVDMVVNNAGIMDRFEPVGELSMELWNKIIAVNLTAPFAVSKLAVNHFLEKSVQGCIVNVGSAASEVGFAAGECI